MWQPNDYSHLSGTTYWNKLAEDLGHLLNASEPAITTLSNSAAFLYSIVERINWAGFYLYDGEKLILGPFCGKPACTTIEIGKGVCGTSAQLRQTVVVEDVETFPGHIACDSESRSEIVIPLINSEQKLIGVLDIDSPEISRFSEEEKIGLQKIAKIIIQAMHDHAPPV